MTALNLWKSNPDDQKIAETFFKNDTGQRLLAVLAECNTLSQSALPGMDGIHEDSKILQRWAGWHRCLEIIPKLFHTSLQGQQGKQDAAEKLAAERRMHLAVASQGPNFP